MVSIWKHSEEVAKLSPNVLGTTPPAVLRKKVTGFYSPFVRDYKKAAAELD